MMEVLLQALTCEEKIRGHVGYPNLKKYIATELKMMEEHCGKVLAELPMHPTPIFPKDSGVDETDTDHITPPSDRRV